MSNLLGAAGGLLIALAFLLHLVDRRRFLVIVCAIAALSAGLRITQLLLGVG